MERALQQTIDDLEIRRVLARYSHGVDRRDRDLIISVYWPEAVDHHGSFKGHGPEFADWVLKQLARERCTVHALAHSLIEFRGEQADVETYFSAHHIRETPEGDFDYHFNGRYIDLFEKRDGVWKILRREVASDFNSARKVNGGEAIRAMSGG